jgi:hypothetical protein
MKISTKKSLDITVLAIDLLAKVKWHKDPAVFLARVKMVLKSWHFDKKKAYKVLSFACVLAGKELVLVTGTKVSEGAWGAFEITTGIETSSLSD